MSWLPGSREANLAAIAYVNVTTQKSPGGALKGSVQPLGALPTPLAPAPGPAPGIPSAAFAPEISPGNTSTAQGTAPGPAESELPDITGFSILRTKHDMKISSLMSDLGVALD